MIKPGTTTQISAGLLVAVVCIMVQARCWPYKNERDNYSAALANFEVFLVMMTALLLQGEGREEFDEENLGYVLITVNLMTVVLFVVWTAVQVFMERSEDEVNLKGSLKGSLKGGLKKEESGLEMQSNPMNKA